MKSGCVMVVDDSAINLALVSYLLESSGCEVRAAESGGRALELLASDGRVDLILCDIQMPVMDGYELARRVRALPGLRQVPLVALTALAMVGDRDRILAAGFDAYISKPIEPVTFLQTLRSLVPHLGNDAAAGPASAPAPAPLPPAPQGQTVLVLDDAPSNLEFKRNLLQPLGYRVVTAQSPSQALKLARAERPDLIISDVGTREGTGFDFIAAVKADPDLRGVPFLFVSATHWDESARARGLALGADAYLRRPIEADALLAEIRRALGKPG